MQARFYKRDFTTPLTLPDVTVEVDRYSWAATGGPDKATLRATGSEVGIWELIEWLRAPVEIEDENLTPLWWGYVSEVRVQVGAIELGVSLDRMYNRVAVAYSSVTPGSNGAGTRATTAWAQDDDSVAAYGTKELLASLSSALDAVAGAKRDALLEAFKWPIPVLRFGQGSLAATIECVGWWQTLNWRYYGQTAGVEQHWEGSGTQAVGSESSERLGQSFTFPSDTDWTAYALHIRARKQGVPADNLRLAIYSNSGGAPGTLLTSGTIAASAFSDSVAEHSVVLSPEITLSYGTTYWFVLERTGALSDADHYLVTIDSDAGYARGALYKYDAGAWAALSPAADLEFRVAGVWETTRQIQELIEGVGQFITAIEIEDASGVKSSPYRDGDALALNVAEELLASGTSNGRRLLATVSRDRILKVSEEPAYDEDTVEIFVRADGTAENRWGNRVIERECPVGKWARIKDVPATLDASRLADPWKFFIERAEYDVGKSAWSPEPRGALTPWDIARLEEG